MPKLTIDDLIAPIPPYRMARPVASLASLQGEAPPKPEAPRIGKIQRAVDAQLEGIADPEKRKQLQDVRDRQLRQLAILKGDKSEKKETREKSQQEKDRQHVEEGLGVRNKDIEREHPDVAAQGEIIANSGAVLLEKSATPEMKPQEVVAQKQEAPPAIVDGAKFVRMLGEVRAIDAEIASIEAKRKAYLSELEESSAAERSAGAARLKALDEELKAAQAKYNAPIPAASKPFEAPLATGYEAELGRMKAKQAELREQGKDKEADTYNEGIKKYEDWKRQQAPATPVVLEKPRVVVEPTPKPEPVQEVPKVSPVSEIEPAKIDEIEAVQPVPVLNLSDEVSIAESLDAQIPPVSLEATPEAPAVPTPIAGARMPQSPSGRLGADGRGVRLTDEERAALQPRDKEVAPSLDMMRPREVPPVARPEARQEAQVEQKEVAEEELPENPSERIKALRRAQEQGGGIGDTIWSAVEWASRKTGAGVWAETFWPRAKSVYHRQFAERRAYHQEKAQRSLERAQSKFEDFKLKAADALWPDKKYYAWRMRVWDKAIAKREGAVNKYDGYRKKRIERHNELQKQVADRYDRELAPYKGKFDVLKREEDLVKKVMAALEADQKKALDALAVAESKRKGLFGRRGAAAATAIKRESDEIARRLNVQRKFLERIQKPLASASAKIEKYESKRKQAVATTKFLEMDNLKGVSRKRAPSSQRESVPRYTVGESSESSREVTSEREDEVWSIKEFAEKWNTNGSENLIRDPKEFEEFVESSRAGAGEAGPIRLGDLFKLAQEYARTNGKVKKFEQDKRYFLARVPKKNS